MSSNLRDSQKTPARGLSRGRIVSQALTPGSSTTPWQAPIQPLGRTLRPLTAQTPSSETKFKPPGMTTALRQIPLESFLEEADSEADMQSLANLLSPKPCFHESAGPSLKRNSFRAFNVWSRGQQTESRIPHKKKILWDSYHGETPAKQTLEEGPAATMSPDLRIQKQQFQRKLASCAMSSSFRPAPLVAQKDTTDDSLAAASSEGSLCASVPTASMRKTGLWSPLSADNGKGRARLGDLACSYPSMQGHAALEAESSCTRPSCQEEIESNQAFTGASEAGPNPSWAVPACLDSLSKQKQETPALPERRAPEKGRQSSLRKELDPSLCQAFSVQDTAEAEREHRAGQSPLSSAKGREMSQEEASQEQNEYQSVFDFL